jgi:hypothetical protein
MNIIEPCCAERQLPALLREQKGRAVLFQTYGDVTFDNILKSVSSMAGNDHLTLTLAAREVTDRMQRTLQRYQQRQWITTLHLLTDDLAGEAICIEGTLGTVIIQGPSQDTAAQRGTPVLYAGQYSPLHKQGGDGGGSHRLATLLDARLRRQSSLADSKGPAEIATPVDDTKKKRTRTKKTKE